MTSDVAVEALTDVVLYISIFAAVVTTVYAVGEPQTRSEVMGRAVSLWLCAVASVVLIVWLVVGIIIRVQIIAGVTP